MSGVIGKWRNDCDTIGTDEVRNALRRMKYGREAGLEELAVEFLTKGGEDIVEWLEMIFNLCINIVGVPEDWRRGFFIVPL